MAEVPVIQGVVNDEGCAVVFQLLGQQKKNGVLKLRSRYGAIDIWLSRGMVTRVEDMNRPERFRLGQMLLRAGLVSADQLAAALAEQRRTRRRLGELLLETGSVAATPLAAMLRVQARETLFNAFRVSRGTYEFVSGSRSVAAPELEGGIGWTDAVMEGGRRVAEWPLIHDVVPNGGCTLELGAPLPTEPIEDDGFDLEGGEDAEALRKRRLVGFPSEQERLVFALITPPTTVQNVVDLARLGDFEVYRALWRMALAGCVTVVPGEEDLPEEEAEPLEGDDTAQRDLMPVHEALRGK